MTYLSRDPGLKPYSSILDPIEKRTLKASLAQRSIRVDRYEPKLSSLSG